MAGPVAHAKLCKNRVAPGEQVQDWPEPHAGCRDVGGEFGQCFPAEGLLAKGAGQESVLSPLLPRA